MEAKSKMRKMVTGIGNDDSSREEDSVARDAR